jgi:cbb3-type cytochrome oxidase subunit 3
MSVYIIASMVGAFVLIVLAAIWLAYHLRGRGDAQHEYKPMDDATRELDEMIKKVPK